MDSRGKLHVKHIDVRDKWRRTWASFHTAGLTCLFIFFGFVRVLRIKFCEYSQEARQKVGVGMCCTRCSDVLHAPGCRQVKAELHVDQMRAQDGCVVAAGTREGELGCLLHYGQSGFLDTTQAISSDCSKL